MVMWLFYADRRVKAKELEQVQKWKECLLCKGLLLRMAERQPNPPYQWVPNGYICSKCNTPCLGVPS